VAATCPYPEPDQSSPCPHIPLPDDPSQIELKEYTAFKTGTGKVCIVTDLLLTRGIFLLCRLSTENVLIQGVPGGRDKTSGECSLC